MKVSKGSWHYRFQEWVFLKVVRGQREVWHEGHLEPATWPPEMDAAFVGRIAIVEGRRMFYASGFYSPLAKATFFDPAKRDNLCPYLRGLVWCVLAIPSVGIGTGAFHAVMTVAYPFVRLRTRYSRWADARAEARPPKRREPKAPKGPGLGKLVSEYWKARHEKICPTIEFVE